MPRVEEGYAEGRRGVCGDEGGGNGSKDFFGVSFAV